MPKAYWVARVDVHDLEQYKRYVAANAGPFAEYGARFLVRGGTFVALEGSHRSRNVVIEFPSLEAAKACYHSPAYQAAVALRGAAVAESDLIIVEGYDGPQPQDAGVLPAAVMAPAPAVLAFWFEEVQPAQWWKVDPAFDALIGTRFRALHEAAVLGACSEWRSTPEGCLAEVIVLDQFSRNLHRGTPRAFAGDALALSLAQQAVAKGWDVRLPFERRAFLYMPYMHSESRAVHQRAEALFRERAPQANFQAELKHKAIVDRFGRYPHRNAVLGRVSSEEELEFLQQPGSSF